MGGQSCCDSTYVCMGTQNHTLLCTYHTQTPHTKRNEELIHATTQDNYEDIKFSKIRQSGSMLCMKCAEQVIRETERVAVAEGCGKGGGVVLSFLLRVMKYSKMLESRSNGDMILRPCKNR